MVIQAYIDDSWDESGTYVLAGYIASVERWASFAKEWESLLPHAVKTEKGNFRFKMSEMMRFGKEADVDLFRKVIVDHVEMGLACVINRQVLRERVDRLVAEAVMPAWGQIEINIEPFKAKWKDPFFFAFRALMDTFHKERVENPGKFKFDGPVDFIFDQDANERFIRESWDEHLESRDPSFREAYGSKPRFEDDEAFLPLQAADFRAWAVRRWLNDRGEIGEMNEPMPFEKMGDGFVPHLLMSAEPDQITNIVSQAIGEAIQQYNQRGGNLVAKNPDSIRFWPRPPL